MRTAEGGDTQAADAYEIVSQRSDFQLTGDTTTTPIEVVTALSLKYGVQFTFNVLQSTYLADGAPPLVALKTSQVNQLCGADHVQAARSAQDQADDGKLYNYLVLTVGTDDRLRTSEVQIRMDQIGLPSAFQQIADAWALLSKLGASAPLVV